MPRFLADYDSVPITFVDGQGCRLVDAKGKKYLDFLGGWCVATVGWRDKAMAAAITRQAASGVYVPPIFRYPAQEELAETLIKLAPGKLRRVFRCTSGSEAVEFAIKCARAATGKPVLVSIDGVYHGHTYGAASLGDACRRKMTPCLPGFIKLKMPKTAAQSQAVVAEFAALAAQRDDIAAFMSEPVWTNAGCFIPPPGFYEGIQKVCRQHGILLVMDEVATGMGRTGKLFASELRNLTPDIVCLGKSFTGGYATMGATLVTEKVYRGSHGIPDYSTFGWLPQDLAAATTNVSLIASRRLTDNAAAVGRLLLDELKPLERLVKVKEVRGCGLVFGIQFRLPIALAVAYACYRRGLVVAVSDASTLFFSPPLALTDREAKEGATIIKAACGWKTKN